MVHCPVAEVLAAGAATLGEPPLALVAGRLDAPVRVGVTGRPGAGRTTVRDALRTAGVTVAEPGQTADLTVHVFVETLTPEDRAAVGDVRRPCVAVLNKADLAGFGGPGPMVTARARCRALERTVAVPVVALAALPARAVLDDRLRAGLTAMAGGGQPEPGIARRLLAELDLFGIAVAVAALADGADPGPELRRASGIDALVAVLDLAGTEIRYRRARSALAVLTGQANARVADFLAGERLVLARMASAAAVVSAAGLPVRTGSTRAEQLRAAIAWQRYADGPVSELHRACGLDISRGALRLWATS